MQIIFRDDGAPSVPAISAFDEQGQPIVLESPQKDRQRQRFDHVARDTSEIVDCKALKGVSFFAPFFDPRFPYPDYGNVMFDILSVFYFRFQIDEALPKRCLPVTGIREYHPSQLMSFDLESLVSAPLDSILVVAGVIGDKFFLSLDLCIVSADEEFSDVAVSDCIYLNVDCRVNGDHFHGYLMVEDTHLQIVSRFEDASALSVYKKIGRGLRITYRGSDEDLVVATTESGRAVVLGSPAEMNNNCEWFEITQV